MRKEWLARGYADGVAYLGECVAGVCPNCGEDYLVYTGHDACGACVEASLMYSQRHGILSDGLADVHTGGRVLPRINDALAEGFLSGFAHSFGAASRAVAK